MKEVKRLVCMLLSLVVLTLGIGYARLTDEITATGNVNFTHESLYISGVTPATNVTVSGYSETLITVTAQQGGTITLSISNPTADSHYYLNYTSASENFTLSDNMAPGAEVKSGASITFTVTFAKAGDYSIKFNFTVVPPAIQDNNDQFIASTNAIAVVNFMLNHIRFGLNAQQSNHGFKKWCTASNRVLYCLDKSVTGGNLKNEFSNIGAANIYYTLEWVSATEYYLYLYYSADADSNLGKYIVAYQQSIVYNSDVNEWVASHSAKGYAKSVKFSKGGGNQIETATDASGNDYVVWYASASELPDGAQLAS